MSTNTSRVQSHEILGINLDPSHELGSSWNPTGRNNACPQCGANNHAEVEVDLVSQFGIFYVWVLTFVVNYVTHLFASNNYKFWCSNWLWQYLHPLHPHPQPQAAMYHPQLFAEHFTRQEFHDSSWNTSQDRSSHLHCTIPHSSWNSSHLRLIFNSFVNDNRMALDLIQCPQLHSLWWYQLSDDVYPWQLSTTRNSLEGWLTIGISYLNVAYHVVPALPSCSNLRLQKEALPYNSHHGIASPRHSLHHDK